VEEVQIDFYDDILHSKIDEDNDLFTVFTKSK